MSTAVTMHQAVGEAALMSSSSSFCRGSALSGQIQSQTMHSAAKPGASLVKGVAAIRCSSFSSADEHSVDRRSPLVNFSSSTRRNPLMDAGLKTTFSYKKEKICATNGATEASLPNFAGSLSHGYDVSEPTKVAADNIEETSESSVLQRLKQGFVKFKEERFLKESELFTQLAGGQSPKVMVIACADSRVCPTMLMGLNPGEVFTVRNVANLVPPCEKELGNNHGTSAALEFAVNYLLVEHIIVIGHRNCGGIKALMSRKPEEFESDFIGSWMTCGIPAREHTLVNMAGKTFSDQCKYCEQEAVNVSLANLLTFPWIKEKFEAGKLGIHGWYYDFVEGELTSWEVQRPVMAGTEESAESYTYEPTAVQSLRVRRKVKIQC
ncbi:carbonic anhydrase [Marchantia polymorpha subsp. ruderalis]